MEYHDENTLHKVQWALQQDLNMSESMTQRAINNMQNAGILFREFNPSADHDWHSGETFTMELPLIDKVETLRLEALTQAIAATPMNQPFGTTQGREFTAQEYLIMQRAERFTQYIIEGRKTNG